MKSVLISTRPKWVEKICHKIGEDETGEAVYEKRIEVRKNAPKEVPFKAYIYETKGQYVKFTHGAHTKYGYGRGKVIGEFICDKVDKIMTLQHTYYNFLGVPLATTTEYCIWNDDLPQMCLTKKEIEEYGKGKTLYGWHISDLKIYDKPKELGDFKKHCHYKDRNSYCLANECEYYSDWTGICCNWVERPPQSWMYVEDLGEEE